ncbi:Uncharacterised protein [Klebsiella pneumoniae]|uniref:Uncharacterized protein n=1 Tax=Klebsiella pneumoniae TaxID=573 RepID=A0A377XS14_KLEPN|nr:Uncharacterised protein [Klebsiella pneumoniae]
MTAVQSKGLPLAGRKLMNLNSTKGHSGKSVDEPDVNGLPLSMVHQWQEYQQNALLPFPYRWSYADSITPMMPLLVRRCVRRVIPPCAPAN